MWWFGRHKSAEDADDLDAVVAPESMPSHRNAFILIGLGGAALATFGVAAIGSIVAPTFLALVLTICVHPVRTGLERRGVPRGIATGSVILVVIALLAGFGYALIIALAQFATLLPDYKDQLQGALQAFVDWLGTIGIGSEQATALVDGFDPTALVGLLGGVLGGLTGFTTWLVIILTMLLLMAMDAGYVPTLLHQLAPRRPVLVGALSAYASNVRRYMVVTTALGVAQGVVNWAALVILGVPGAFLWGMLSFLCSYIPNIGYFIAIIPPIVFGALTGGWPLVIGVIVVYGVVNAVIQSVIQPRVVGNAVALSQTITFFSVLFWAIVLGPIGAILAIPATLLVRLMLIDSNPDATWMRPILGDLDAAKAEMEAEDAEHKAERKARKASPPPASSAG